MKSDVIITISRMNKAGNNMFSGMILHQGEPVRPVNPAQDLLSRLKLFRQQMDNCLPPFFHMQNRESINRSTVTGLSSAFREERRLIQYRFEPFGCLPYFQHCGLCLLHMTVFIIQSASTAQICFVHASAFFPFSRISWKRFVSFIMTSRA